MSDLSMIEKTKLESLFGMSGGYVYPTSLTDRKFQELVAESVDLNILSEKYARFGTSKANRLRTFWDIEPNDIVSKLLFDLIEYGKECVQLTEEQKALLGRCQQIAERLQPKAIAKPPSIEVTDVAYAPNDTKPSAWLEPTSAIDSPQEVSRARDLARDKVFLSYSHKDKKYLAELETHLKPLERTHRITSWSDSQIKAGSEWFNDIQEAVATTRVAVLLVSASFLASDFIIEHELAPFLKEAVTGGVDILWVLVKPCVWKSTPIQKYHAAISPDRALASLKPSQRHEAWVKVCEKIQKHLE
ncbi:MAG: toll/interleukin-1 receptor domain-containing protein [Gemmataceae bacterium]